MDMCVVQLKIMDFPRKNLSDFIYFPLAANDANSTTDRNNKVII